jgi:hypothetical protein
MVTNQKNIYLLAPDNKSIELPPLVRASYKKNKIFICDEYS